MPLRAIPLGRGLLGLLRAAFGEGRAQDVLAWLRTPGVLDRPGLADELETAVRVDGATTAAEARRLWEAERWPLELLDRLDQAHGPGLLDAVAQPPSSCSPLPASERPPSSTSRSVSTPPRCGPCWTCSRG